MPNFKSYHADTIPYWRNLDAQNGDLYVWQESPDQIQMTSEPLDMCVRVDALEAMGWPDLDTTDDYIAFIEGALEKIPETNGRPSIGFGAFWEDPVGVLLTTYLPRHSGYQHFYKFTGMVDVDNAKIVNLVEHSYFNQELVANCDQMGNAVVVDKHNEQLKSIVNRLEELSKRYKFYLLNGGILWTENCVWRLWAAAEFCTPTRRALQGCMTYVRSSQSRKLILISMKQSETY